MNPPDPAPHSSSLAQENARLRAELERLRARLAAAEAAAPTPGAPAADADADAPLPAAADAPLLPPLVRLKHALTTSQCERYARHLVLPAFGARAQARVCARSALVVGCGGLGSPAALYLAAAGVGTLGLCDRDTVELSNLHRQVAHSESRVGAHKALSAAEAARALNSGVRVQTFLGGLSAEKAVEIVSNFDVVLDCTDNAPARYLLSDACAAAGRPLVSAAAVGTDGQLTVYCRGRVAAGGGGGEGDEGEGDEGEDDDTPCYRCLFPDPPVPESCARCAEAGVLGPVPGVMGVLQALEALKLLAGAGGRGSGGGGRGGGSGGGGGGIKTGSSNDNSDPAVIGDLLARRMLIYDALAARFMTVTLRARRDDCVACGARRGYGGKKAAGQGTLAAAAEAGGGGGGAGGAGRLRAPGAVAATDYEAFTGQSASDALPPSLRVIPDEERVTAAQLAERLRDGAAAPAAEAAAGRQAGAGAPPPPPPLVLLDVRPPAQFDVMALAGAVNVPFSDLDRRWAEVEALAVGGGEAGGADAAAAAATPPPSPLVVVVCRRGNHSQLCARRLRAALVDRGLATEDEAKARVRDLVGGYESWGASCEPHVPVL